MHHLTKFSNNIKLITQYKIYIMNFKIKVNKLLVSCISIFIIGVFFQGCDRNVSLSTEPYLEINKTQDVWYESDFEVYIQARDRMDKYVKVENNRYTTSLKSGESISISEDLFSLLKEQMEQTNLLIKNEGIVLSGKTFYSTINIEDLESIEIPRLKSASPEVPTGGVTKVVVQHDWYGTYYHFYISNSTLFYAGQTATLLTVVSALAPEPVASKAVTAACGLASVIANTLVYQYPNGIIVKVFAPLSWPGWCIPYSLTTQ